MNIELALKLFRLKIGDSMELVKAAYRREAQIHHPDKGGDAEIFKKVKFTYDFLCKHGTTPKPVAQVASWRIWNCCTVTSTSCNVTVRTYG